MIRTLLLLGVPHQGHLNLEENILYQGICGTSYTNQEIL